MSEPKRPAARRPLTPEQRRQLEQKRRQQGAAPRAGASRTGQAVRRPAGQAPRRPGQPQRRPGQPQRRPQGQRRSMTPEQYRAYQRKRWLMRNLKFIIPGCAALVIIIVLAIALPSLLSNNDTSEAQTAQLTLETPAPEETAETEDTAAASSALTAFVTPEPDAVAFNYDEAYVRAVNGEITGEAITPRYDNVDETKLSRWPEITENMLPMFYKASGVTDNTICVTVDDCYQGENLRQIVQCALDNDSKLTIFPIGENIDKENIGSVVKWAWENGMEIENHTYSHVGLYHYDDETMTDEIWNQWMSLCKCLGVNYTEHFFRPHGGDGRYDQRNHAYVSQLGLYGLAIWSDDGSKSSIETLKNNIEAGNIYLFHTTDNDLKLMSEFIPYAVSQGYRLVTMNEMFGLPDNEYTDISTLDTTKPALHSFKIDVKTLKDTSYMRAAAVVQQRLIDLGWLSGDADGEFGPGSAKATSAFQSAIGLTSDGMMGAETQKVLFSDSAPTK